LRGFTVHACSDITGFGLLGHATEIASKSGVRLVVDADVIPWLPGAQRYAHEERLPGGAYRNRQYYEPLAECGVTFGAGVSAINQQLLFSPETSGGLLAAVPPDEAPAVLTEFESRGLPIWRVGHVEIGRGIDVR
jgi:selenide,water dikinase